MTDKNANGINIRETLKSDWYIFIIILVPLFIALYFYSDLPELMPSHWDMQGNVDDYSSKAFAVWFFPLLNLGLYFLLLLAPKIDPRRENYQRFTGAYRAFRIGLIAIMSAIYFITILVALGYTIKVDLFVKVIIALLFIIIGNFMGKLQHNYFIGIRTPWTLASEEVWRRTHRLSGKIWVLCGTICFVLGFSSAAWANYLYFIIIIAMSFFLMIASYIFYRQLQQ